MTSKAPVGGIVSPVNGQFYDGGRFTPDHGKFCGKGKNRVTVERFEAVAAKVAAAGKSLEYVEATGEFVVRLPGGNIMFRVRNLDTLTRCF